MSRRNAERLADLAEATPRSAATWIAGSDGLIFDAVRVRLILRAGEPTQPWSGITRMRDHLAHHYFDTEHARS